MVGMDGEFERIDINQCDISEGNERPNFFAGTHRCRPTTMVSTWSLSCFCIILGIKYNLCNEGKTPYATEVRQLSCHNVIALLVKRGVFLATMVAHSNTSIL